MATKTDLETSLAKVNDLISDLSDDVYINRHLVYVKMELQRQLLCLKGRL